MQMYKILKPITIFSWIAVICWLILIFSFSAQPAVQSDGLSRQVTKIILEIIDIVIPVEEIGLDQLNSIIRKLAHFGVYLVLGVLINNAFEKSGVKDLKGFMISLLFCVLYAISDEVHQLYVPGRGAQVTDVLIDSWGAFVGINMIYWYRHLIKYRVKVQLKKK